VQRERDQLLREKMSVLHNMMIADRIVSLGLLAAGMSHHIRNSLVAVKTFLDLAPAKLREENLDIDGLRNPEFWRDYYQNVQGQIERITCLLRDLWEVSEKPTFEFADEVALPEIVAGAVTGLKEGLAARNITVQTEVPSDLPSLRVDRRKFSRLFELLLKDELVSLPAGSRISVSAQLVPETNGEPAHIKIELADNGPGLPAESLRLIFDPFVARSDSPVDYGINLMACYFIVHHHGGKIEAHSEVGEGTRFVLRIPLNPNQAAPPEPSDEFLQKVLLNDSLWEKLMRAA